MKRVSIVDFGEDILEDFLNKRHSFKLVTDITSSVGHTKRGKVVVTRRAMKGGDIMNPEFEKTFFVDTDTAGVFSAVTEFSYKGKKRIYDISNDFNAYVSSILNSEKENAFDDYSM